MRHRAKQGVLLPLPASIQSVTRISIFEVRTFDTAKNLLFKASMMYAIV